MQGIPNGRRLGCVNFDFERSTVYLIQPRLMGIWQNWLGRLAGWLNIQIKVNPTQVNNHLVHPVFLLQTCTQLTFFGFWVCAMQLLMYLTF